jgi:hypothetical protein
MQTICGFTGFLRKNQKSQRQKSQRQKSQRLKTAKTAKMLQQAPRPDGGKKPPPTGQAYGRYTNPKKRSRKMKKSTMLRLGGGAVILVILTLAGRYNITGIPLLLATFGFAFGYEYLVVRPASKAEKLTNQ